VGDDILCEICLPYPKEQWVKDNKCWKMKLQESIKYVGNMRKHKMLKL